MYWVFNLLEGSFEVVLANAHHMKAVPGWKTDVKDCTDREPLAHALIRSLERLAKVAKGSLTRVIRFVSGIHQTETDHRDSGSG